MEKNKRTKKGREMFPEGKLTLEIAEELLKAEEIYKKQQKKGYYRE